MLPLFGLVLSAIFAHISPLSIILTSPQFFLLVISFLILLLQWFWSVPESKLCQIKNVGTLRKHPCKSLVLVKFSVLVQYYFSLLQILFKQTFSCEFYLGYDICLPFLFAKSIMLPLREYCPNMEFFLVCIFPHSD